MRGFEPNICQVVEGVGMNRLFVGVLVAFVCCSASAMTLVTYRNLEQKAELAGSKSSYQNLAVLTALRTGVASTLESLRSQDGSIRLNGKLMICAPSSVHFSTAIVRAAIDTAAKEQDKAGQQGPADELDVVLVAERGLALMYPCEGAAQPDGHG